MTSNEALEKLLDFHICYRCTAEKECCKTCDSRLCYEAVKKDLEVLEILKKNLYVHQTNAKDLFELRAIFDLETYDEEERQENQKVKEWLEHE